MIGGYSGYRLFWRLAPFEGRKKEEDCMAELKFGYGRVVHQDYSDQLFRRLFRDVKQYTVEVMLENMEKMAYEILRTAYAEKEFISVTGNLINSFAVGIYYKGELKRVVGAADMGIDPPVRVSLSPGEKLSVTRWWDAVEPYESSKGKIGAFKGKIGPGHVDGRKAAIRKLQSTRPWKRDTYALIVVAPMVYADYVQNKQGLDVLTAVKEVMPQITKICYV